MNLNKLKSRRARLAMLGFAALVVVLVVVAVASGGGSPASKSAVSPAAASTSAGRSSFVQCMKEHGVTITRHAGANGAPQSHTGAPPAGIRGSSVNPAREAAFKACGTPGQHTGGGHPRGTSLY